MADKMEQPVHSQEFIIRNLSTRSVTLYPSRAYVVRDITGVTLKTGSNEITIYGLTPTTDESSIKVDGKGSATITDISVDLVRNRDTYENVYPSESESDESDEDSVDTDEEPEATKSIAEEVKQLRKEFKDETEDQDSAFRCIAYLENFGQSFRTNPPSNLTACMDKYRIERKKAFEITQKCAEKMQELQKMIDRKTKDYIRLGKESAKEKEKVRKAKAKMWEQKARARMEKIKGKSQIKEERLQFFAKKVYRVVVRLDTNIDWTPSSSRRGSIESITKSVASPTPGSNSASGGDPYQVSLSLSYITHSAYWLPRYELSLSTQSRSGAVVYRAEFRNETSETWQHAKIILSTSQTSFQGLGEPIPTLSPWHVRLAKNVNPTHHVQALYSNSEYQYRNAAKLQAKTNEPRNLLFGKPDNDHQQGDLDAKNPYKADSQAQQLRFGQQSAQAQLQHQLQHRQPQQQQVQRQQLQQQSANFGGQVFPLSSSHGGQAQQPQMAKLCSASSASNVRFSRAAAPNVAAEDIIDYSDEEQGFDHESTIVPQDPTLSFQSSTWEETGLTTSYDVPGLRTITPSFVSRRHKIASIGLKDVQFYYVLVPKLRPAAFLKARLKNSSSTTLLRGMAGLTLDSSFLGNTVLPRSSAGEIFSLSLGVDPALNVNYSKPAVKRSQTGLFTKENGSIYTRTCIVTNTKAGTAVEGVVLDQVPVSEDERLKMEVLVPRGLKTEGDQVRCGEKVGSDEKWGKAVATLKKGGEVCFDLKLNPGQGVRLALEYEAKFPGSETVVSA